VRPPAWRAVVYNRRFWPDLTPLQRRATKGERV